MLQRLSSASKPGADTCFLANSYAVPSTGRPYVVVQKKCELGNKAALEEATGARSIDDGLQLQMCIDVAAHVNC
ncbi:unnamed protein product [Peronospora destructor]|uniref:Uncharacterized protein n=1 Tax=Peronospora destructor TaxID=86335 RepID=A0AAV0T302_9STRA|nr:unnamed protein product [Peronospora destructor]